MAENQRAFVPSKKIQTDYPVSRLTLTPPIDRVSCSHSSSIATRTAPCSFSAIDSPSCRHFKRVMRYARPSDYAAAAATTALGPGLMLFWERISPSHVGRGGFAPIMRLTTAISAGAGFLLLYQKSARLFLPAPPQSLTSMADEVWPSPLLWLDREQTRDGHGHARDGRQGQAV